MIIANSSPFLHSPLPNEEAPGASRSRTRRNVGEPGTYWPQNSTIKIALYGYDMNGPWVQAVKNAANQWLPHINLKFEFVSGEEGDVRISYRPLSQPAGSDLGTNARDTLPGEPNMHLPADPTDPDFEKTVIHEFGHMLGAHHAHQHPDSNIPWNVPHTYAYYGRQGLSENSVRSNILPLPRSDAYSLLPYDGDSIMHYHIGPEVTDGSWAQSESHSLSEGDKAWASNAYPRTGLAE